MELQEKLSSNIIEQFMATQIFIKLRCKIRSTKFSKNSVSNYNYLDFDISSATTRKSQFICGQNYKGLFSKIIYS